MSPVATEVAVPRARIQNAGAAMEQLAQVFHDRVPRLVGQSARYHFFELSSVHVARPAQDPDLIETASDLLGLRPDEISDWRTIEDDPVSGRRFAMMLEHCHALEAWCDAPLLRPDGTPTLLLHIDAHDDLNAPSLLPGSDGHTYLAPIGPGVMFLDDRKTVRRFVTRGYVGIGGFIAPMIGASAIDAMVHVVGSDDPGSDHDASLVTGSSAETGFMRIEKFGPDGHGIPYRRTSLRAALEMAQRFSGRILLDIDFDGFCNRYDTNGGSTTSDGEAITVMGETLDALRASGIPQRAVVITLALSPGFFPAALWAEALRFCDALRADSRVPRSAAGFTVAN